MGNVGFEIKVEELERNAGEIARNVRGNVKRNRRFCKKSLSEN